MLNLRLMMLREFVALKKYALIMLALLLGCDGSQQVSSIEPLAGNIVANVLKDLSVSSGDDQMFPDYEHTRNHYGIKCDLETEVIVSFSAFPSQTVEINGSAVDSPVSVIPSTDTETIDISVRRGEDVETYQLQCIPADFLEIEIITAEGYENGADSLYALSPRYRVEGQILSFLLIIDDMGVPHFLKRIPAAVTNFNQSPDGGWSYLETVGRDSYGWKDNEFVILDSGFNEVSRVRTIGLNQTDNHESIITPGGTYILSSYNTSFRDLTEYGLAADQETRDSVVQEITPSGELIFEWDSWGKLNLDNCLIHRWPDDYAHLNSVSIASDGNLILSLRGCSQVIKVDRDTGETIWILGGAGNNDFEIVGDPFKEFCGQHTAFETSSGNIGMFDNGGYCNGDREETFGQFSRYVEYRLDSEASQAHFVKDYSLYNENEWYTASGGSVQELGEDSMLINWARVTTVSATEVVDSEVVRSFRLSWDGQPVRTYRFYKLP